VVAQFVAISINTQQNCRQREGYDFRVLKANRFAAILEALSTNGSLGVTDIARQLGVSDATIRRDLKALEDERLLSRTHGGAMAHGLMYELPLRYKSARQQEEKLRIARLAAERVTDGMVVGLTGGTTTTEVARALVARERLTIVTNALNIAFELAGRPSVKIVVTGGVARSESYELVGPLAEQTLGGINMEVVFVGADGISLDAGLTTHHEVEAHTDQALIGRAHTTIAVADSSKLGKTAFSRICDLSVVDELITDDKADPSIVSKLGDIGVKVTPT
jgi:DeoR family transcriptional regulator of aga operon